MCWHHALPFTRSLQAAVRYLPIILFRFWWKCRASLRPTGRVLLERSVSQTATAELRLRRPRTPACGCCWADSQPSPGGLSKRPQWDAHFCSCTDHSVKVTECEKTQTAPWKQIPGLTADWKCSCFCTENERGLGQRSELFNRDFRADLLMYSILPVFPPQ